MELFIDDPYFQDKAEALTALHRVIDPELFVNIIDLGLVYDIDFSEEGLVVVTMTLSSPHCPLGDAIVEGVNSALSMDFPQRVARVELVFDPPWNYKMMTEEGKQLLGISE